MTQPKTIMIISDEERKRNIIETLIKFPYGLNIRQTAFKSRITYWRVKKLLRILSKAGKVKYIKVNNQRIYRVTKYVRKIQKRSYNWKKIERKCLKPQDIKSFRNRGVYDR